MKNIPLLKNTICIVFPLFIHTAIFAQENKSKITFLEESYDFGKLDERQGEAKYTFKFVNTGQDSVKLLSVNASCGCTTPYWEKAPLQPGDTGRIVVAYNPLNRPGSFKKSVTVSSNADPAVTMLSISGFVEPKTLSVEEKFPIAIGGIRFKSNYLNFGTISTEKAVTKSFGIYNQSDDTIRFSDNIVSGDFLKADVLPIAIAPKKEAILQLTYHPKKRNDLGFMNDQLVLFTDEAAESNKTLSVITTILEYFPPMTEEELAKAPTMQIGEDTHDFGHVNEGEVLKHSFIFSNQGQKTLNIRKMKSSCSCVVSSLKTVDYKAGTEGELEVTFDTSGTTGSQVKKVSLFTNDPTAPVKDVIIKAYVRD